MDLHFDKMCVETSLANDYLDEHKELSQLLRTGKQEDVTISPGEKKTLDREDIPSTLNALAERLKENTNLIAQLEYLMREISIEDTKAQLDLVIKQLRYVASVPNEDDPTPSLTDHIVMKVHSPLLVLGYTAKIFQYQLQYFLNAEDTAAPIGHLFTKLCHSAGLPIVTRLCQSENYLTREYRMPGGSVGVVAEYSDVDSAVDVLLTSSKQVPWRLRHIFVQESVYLQFKDALIWKCNLNKQSEVESADKSSDALEFDGRMFLIDAVPTMDPQSTAVTIEAYRTTKELKTLLHQRRPHYVSLWANDIAAINELTHGIHSPVVWVNSFGDFRGPAKVSEAVYSHTMFGLILPEFSIPVRKDKDLSQLVELKQSWQKLCFEARRDVLSKALDECVVADPTRKYTYTHSKQTLHSIDSNTQQGAFVDVGRDYVCLGISAPANELFIINQDFPFNNFLESLLQGNGFFYREGLDYTKALSILRKAGAPVVCKEQNEVSPGDCKVYLVDFSYGTPNDFTITTRVIWTNAGSIFAN